ncbi:DUF3347 domain-containing protein [Pontibacter locisalis]|uniref:DUF3347 domain-containing protein n=1 Tax=Pontibacter locisalis TaxID=1719035 RepID=A0ABW5IPQ7_9BACT
MKKTFFTAAVIAAFAFTACSETTTENAEVAVEQTEEMDHSTMDHSQMPTSVVVETPNFESVSEPMQTQIEQLVDQYMKLKDALVASDAQAAQAAANEVVTVAKAMPVATLTTDEKAYAEEKTQEVISSATSIASANDLAAQRENLEMLSESVFSLAKAFNAADETLYYQHCPMAMDNKGGYWLSSNEEIRNPYFGESMLKCGSVEEVYKK